MDRYYYDWCGNNGYEENKAALLETGRVLHINRCKHKKQGYTYNSFSKINKNGGLKHIQSGIK